MTRFKARSSAHTIRKRHVWTQNFLNTEKRISVFQNTRLRVDEASDDLPTEVSDPKIESLKQSKWNFHYLWSNYENIFWL